MTGQRCDGCGAPDAVQSVWDEVLCPQCMTHYALAHAAHDHLRSLLKTAMKDYFFTWAAHSRIIQDADDAAGVLAQEIAGEALAEVLNTATR